MRPEGKGDLAQFPDGDPQMEKPNEGMAVGLCKRTNHWQLIRYSHACRQQEESPELKGAWDSVLIVWADDRAPGGRMNDHGCSDR